MSENPPLPPILGSTQRPLPHVLTLTPFYPSESNDSSGCFVAEPIEELSKRGLAGPVLAVQPFYRGKLHARNSDARSEWLRYFSLPGGIGLPSAGAFLFARIVAQVRELQKAGQVDLVHAHGALPCGHAAMLLNAELKLPYVVSVHGLDAFSTEQVSGRSGEWCRRVPSAFTRIQAE